MKLMEYQRLVTEGRIKNRRLKTLELAGTALVIAGSLVMLGMLLFSPGSGAWAILALGLTLSAVGIFAVFLFRVWRLRPPDS